MTTALFENEEDSINAFKNTLPTLHSIQEIENILKERIKNFTFHTLRDIPHPQKLRNNMQASLMICESIFKNEKIIIVGDYDADGICATCIILDFFESLAYPYIAFAIPNRFVHGYGFSKKLFAEILQNHPDVKLIITVDNGVSSFEAGKMCKEKGIKFIITDHHTLEVDAHGKKKIPYCDFLINPQQKECTFPFKDICGSLVAWYLCCAIKITMQQIYQNPHLIINKIKATSNATIQPSFYKRIKNQAHLYVKNLSCTYMESFLILVGIAIISDVMPLNAINHTICKYALRKFTKSRKFAIQALLEYLHCTIDSQSLGFRLIPLLNAAGRINDGKIALEFLRSKSLLEAKQYLKQLKDLNNYRKQLQDEVTQQAFYAIQRFIQKPNMTCVVGDNWHEGVLGIVAGKMADEFKQPCFVLTHINGVCKGSGRSYGDIDLISSMQKLGHLLNRYGGHVGAVGLEIAFDNIQVFIDSFEAVTYLCKKPENILGILSPHLITHELLQKIHLFEPYGNGNPIPKFFIELEILECKVIGQGFLEFQLKLHKDQSIKAIFFNAKYATHHFYKGAILQFQATLTQDTYQNTDDIMLIVDKIYGLQRK